MENPQIVARLNEQSRLEYEQKERSYTRYLMAIKDRPDVAQDLDLSISLATLQKPNSLLQGMEAKSAGVVRKFLEDVNKDLDFSQESLLSRVSIPQLPKIELEPLKFEKYLEKDKADKQEPSNQ